MTIRFRLLGPIEVTGMRGESVVFDRGKRAVLLALLLRQANRRVSLGTVVQTLWEKEPPESAQANVRTYASQLRAALCRVGMPRLESPRGSYLLRVDCGESDVEIFAEAVTAADAALATARPTDAQDHLRRALEVWRGQAADGLTGHGPLKLALDALDEQRAATVEKYAAVCLRLADRSTTHTSSSPIPHLRMLLAEQPLRENAWLLLMRSLADTGDRAGALAAYGSARQVLRRELGLEPSVELRRAQEEILHA
ncbi:MAG TPA: AfsR/SARP family transcriptional regulator [Phytomonospora sp.]